MPETDFYNKLLTCQMRISGASIEVNFTSDSSNETIKLFPTSQFKASA